MDFCPNFFFLRLIEQYMTRKRVKEIQKEKDEKKVENRLQEIRPKLLRNEQNHHKRK